MKVISNSTVCNTTLCLTWHCPKHQTMLDSALSETPHFLFFLHCPKHHTTLDSALSETPNYAWLGTVRNTKLPLTRHCPKHHTTLDSALSETSHCIWLSSVLDSAHFDSALALLDLALSLTLLRYGTYQCCRSEINSDMDPNWVFCSLWHGP